MNYIDQINWFWLLDAEHLFNGNETRLYFYLLKLSNSLYWKNPLTNADGYTASMVGISVNTLKTCRNRLQQAGLIKFKPGGNGARDKCLYEIMPTNKVSNSDTLNNGRYQNLTPNPYPNLEPYPQPYLQKADDIYKHKLNETKPSTDDGAPPGFQIEVYANIEAFKQSCIQDVFFMSIVSQKGVEPAKIPLWLDAFNRRLIFTKDTMKSETDYRKHFSNWLVKIPNYRTINPMEYDPVKDIPQQLEIGRKVILKYFMGGEVTWSEEQYKQYCNNPGASGYSFIRYEN